MQETYQCHSYIFYRSIFIKLEAKEGLINDPIQVWRRLTFPINVVLDLVQRCQ